MFTFWDIGLSDYVSIWLIQPTDRFFLVLDWFEAEGLAGSAMPDQMLRWENKWKKPIARHFLPHDANTRAPGSGKSYVDELRSAGLENITVVPRIPDKWQGIGYVRDVLPHCYFHKTNCDTPRQVDGMKLPSGVACLKGYHKEISASKKTIREMPAHDHFSHSSDAFRTFAEAHRLQLIEQFMGGGTRSKPGVVGGISKPSAKR